MIITYYFLYKIINFHLLLGLRGKRSAEVDNVNRVSGASPFPSYTAAWPGATVSVDHGKRKRSAEPHGYFGYYGHPFYYHPYAYFHGPAAKPAAIDGDAYTAEWPGATVSVDHIAKRSAELVDNVNQVSGSSPFPSYTAAWPGATVSVNHLGKRSADAEGDLLTR